MDKFKQAFLDRYDAKRKFLKGKGQSLSVEEMVSWMALTAEKRAEEHVSMKKAIEDSNERIKKQADVFFDKEAIQGLVLPAAKMNWGRSDTRYAMGGLYAIIKGMKMEEVLSDDPKLNKKKSDYGKELMEKMQIISVEKFLDKKDGSENYQSYVNRRKKEIMETFNTMHEALLALPLSFENGVGSEQLAKDYQKYSFILGAKVELIQIAGKHLTEDNKTTFETMETGTRKLDLLECMVKQSEFIASDAYLGVRDLDESAMAALRDGYAFRAVMDQVVPACKGAETVGDIQKKLDENHVTIDERIQIQMKLSSPKAITKKWAEQALEYVITGEEPMHTYDPQTMECKLLPASEDWMDFETFDLDDEKSVKMESVRTMSFKELMTEDTAGKTMDVKESKKPSVSKSEERKKVKEDPKLGKK